ncbi:efflux RND transporter periplasmic adaptor subunit [Sphingomonas morindae]|uniref:Efflux RND transporter periplasmic adaptor subunit n=1 Tax=Sphingomonas morindae TaxID=1541170 RepID=A0ABY4XDL7_9SPHN|nr:efflux RND transporter periplasmic adaptor subunit [Sphingomonas morindae]USI75070.1 efflux RND transporter periplasmic adaptor subunit [Sphingomonas morindae]
MLGTITAAETAPRPRRATLWRRGTLLLLPVALVGYGGYRLVHPAAPEAAAPPPASVTTATPLARTVTEWDDYVGRFTASQSVEVRPRVSGQIVARHFTDGQMVRKGQLLFTVDPRPFRAAEGEARADVAAARSSLALARADLARAERLSGDEALSAGEVDRLRSRAQAAAATLAGAEARLRSRALDVEWTEVRAPISGRVSDRRVDTGNLVTGGQTGTATLLTTINAIDPIYFSFDASEALVLKARHARAAGAGPARVEVRLQDETDYRWKGSLDFEDNGLDQRSGTLRARATIANPQGFLTPGLFGNMRLASGGTARALLVPEAAIQTDQARKTVLVVGPDNVVAAKPVTLGASLSGLRIVRQGLDPRDRVVIGGLQAAVPGSKVDPHPGRIAADAATPPATAETPPAAQASFAR